MAISPQKLLPQSGATGIRLSSSIVKTSNLSNIRARTPNIENETSTPGGKLVPIYESLVNINDIFNKRSKDDKEQVIQKKQQEDKKEKKQEEDKLELKNKKQKIDLPKVQNPFASFFDRLKNALVLLFVGWLVNRFFDYIPKILEGVSNFMKTLEDIRKFLKPATDALGSALYNVTLAGTKMLGAITGANIDKNEKDLAVAINELDKKFSIINALMAGIIIGDIFSAVADGLDLFERPGRGGTGGSPLRSGKELYKAYDPKRALIQKKYGDAFAKLYDLEIAKGLNSKKATENVLRRYVDKGKITPQRKIGIGGIRGSNLFNKGIGRAPGRLATRILGRGGLRMAGKVFGRIPIIGGLIDFVINLAMGEKPGRAAAKAIGATVGAGLGTLIPIPFAGTILGGFLGDLLGGAVYDMFAPKDTQKKKGPTKKTEKPKGYFLGGLVSGVGNFFSGKSARVSKPSSGTGLSQKLVQQTPTYSPTIKPLLINPNLVDKIGAEVLKGFVGVSNALSSAPFVGPFAALGINLALGKERFNKSTALSVAAGIGNLLGNPLAVGIYNFLNKAMPGLGNLVQKVVGKNFGEFLSGIITQILGTELYKQIYPMIDFIKNIMNIAQEEARREATRLDGDNELDAADLAAIKASGADKKAAAHLATLEATTPQHVADVFQVVLNRAKGQSGGIAAVITAREQFTPYSAALYGGSPGDPAASAKYGKLGLTKKELFELAGKTDGLEQLVKRFGAGNASVAGQVLADFEKNGPLSKSSKKFVGGAQYFLGYAKNTPDERRRPDGGNFFRDAYGGGTMETNFRSMRVELEKMKMAKIKPSKPQSMAAMSYPKVSQFASYDRPSTVIQPIRQVVYVPMSQQQSGGVVMVGSGGVNNTDYQIAAIKAAL
jgi:hypothetical protein